MPIPAARRIRTLLAVFALVLIGSATISLPASAAVPDNAVPDNAVPANAVPDDSAATVTGPADGAVIGGTAVTFSAPTADQGNGYDLRWGTDPTVDAQTGRLVSIVGGGEEIVTTTEYALIDLAEQTYYWQVLSLDDPAAEWSVPRSFIVDPEAAGVQLETYPLDAGSGAPLDSGPFAGVAGGVWIGSATVFAVLFLAIVIFGRLRTRDSV